MKRKIKMVLALGAVTALFAIMNSAAQATFTSAKYPATITGTSTKDVIDVFGSTRTCTNNSFSGSLSAASNSLVIVPSYKSCTAFGLPITVTMTSCHYVLKRFPGGFTKTDIECSKAGDSIDEHIYASGAHTTAICHVNTPAQSERTGMTITNSGSNIVLSGSVGALTVTQNRTSVFCPAGTHTSTGTYTIQAGGITLSGNNGAISVD